MTVRGFISPRFGVPFRALRAEERKATSQAAGRPTPHGSRPQKLLAACWLLSVVVRAASPTQQETEFFESRIRPILVNQCYKCHSETSERVKGGLKLDTRANLLKGGDTGVAIVPGNPEKSLLIKAIRYKDEDLKMPPNDRKLTDAQIADLEAWVRMGAPDPRSGTSSGVNLYEIDKANAAKHWAFQMLFYPPVPRVEDKDNWAQTDIDRYILAGLRREGLSPSPRADKTSLIRRATFDLTGLPPTPAEVDAFLADNAPTAFSNVVVRLLTSPRYGERWGRYWLDLARYADTKGSAGEMAEPRYLYSYTYRDYVIRAFNDDLPYNQFLIEQIAADKLPPDKDNSRLAALGFLTLGNRFNNNADDIIDDRIDVLSKSTLALTVTCARCHDHKFDPIPTADYYSLHGVFSSCYEPTEGPVLGSATNTLAYQQFSSELDSKQAELDREREAAEKEARRALIGRSGDYLLALAEIANPTNTIPKNQIFSRRALNRRWAGGWEKGMSKWSKEHDPVFAPWVEFVRLAPSEFAAKAPELAARYRANADPNHPINPLVARSLATPPKSLADLAARYSELFLEVEGHWQNLVSLQTKLKAANSEAASATRSLEPDQEQLRLALYDRKSPLHLEEQIVTDAVMRDNKTKQKIAKLQATLDDLKINHPGAPARAMALLDKDSPHDDHVYLRGNAATRGPLAPRRFLEILSPDHREEYHDGSGRLELAKAIASDDNPLTARVMVNRIWQGHFGEGIVRTPNDFGLRSEPPTHPELLDYLALSFMDHGWSIKKLHLQIMLSSTYQQSSEDNPRQAQKDPNNRWLWRMNRRRLDFESLRDTILAIGGKLDLTMGGPSVKLDSVPHSERRTVYGFVDRNRLPTMYRVFDFANPDLSTGKRDLTTVPQQALFLMNSPLVVEQAMNLVRRPDFSAQSRNEDRVRLLYRLIYQRAPTEAETKLALNYLQSEPRKPKTPIPGQSPWEYGTGYVDPVFKRVTFLPMTQFASGVWRGPAGSSLTARGGFPPEDPRAVVVRRWISPVEGAINIDGVLEHGNPNGDGVQGHIISSRSGELGTWVAFKDKIQTSVGTLAVVEGEMIDFVVDCRTNAKGDNFVWAPTITFSDAAEGETTAPGTTWSAQKDFSGVVRRRLYVWEKLAQVLLETNEMAFYN